MERVAPVSASARRLPVFTYSIDEPSEGNSTSICSAIRSVSAGALPRYGTWIRLTLAIILNSSPERWPVLPMPDDLLLIWTGLVLAWAVDLLDVLVETEE